MRDDFPRQTIETLAKRVGQRCSNPACGKPTSGAHTEPSRSIIVGVAAHITAASAGGPRYDPDLSPEERRSISNGIWLCQTCAKLVDSDEARFSIEVLRSWKRQAEEALTRRIESSTDRTEEGRDEGHSIRFAVDDWKVCRRQGNRPGDIPSVSRWAEGDLLYSCVIRLRNESAWEEQIHRLRIEFRRGEQVVFSDDSPFGDREVTLPPRRWISLDVDDGLHDDAPFAESDSVWFTAETLGDNVKLAWCLAGLDND